MKLWENGGGSGEGAPGKHPVDPLGTRRLGAAGAVSVLIGADMGLLQDWRTRTAEPPEGRPPEGELCFVALSTTHSSVLVARPWRYATVTPRSGT